MKKKNRLQELLELLNISAAEMSRSTGIPKSSISMWLSGERTMRQDKIGIISNHYHIDPSWLMGYDVPIHRDYEQSIEDFRKIASEQKEMLSQFEYDIIRKFRSESKDMQDAILRILKLDEDTKQLEQRLENLYSDYMSLKTSKEES